MIELNCRLARMDATAMPAWLTDDPDQIAETFRRYSRGDIALRIDSTRLATPRKPGRDGVEAYDLHRALAQVTGNVATPIANIAVLYASRFIHARYAQVFGIMFDRGFATTDDPSGSQDFMRIPREGCAVFLDTIRELRPEAPPPSEDPFERESLFTTIHELGHLFNLQHLAGKNFMASSLRGAPFDLDYHVFTETQCNKLARCSTSPDVRPGGSIFGGAGFGGHVNQSDRSQPDEFGLALSLSIATHRFWRFEPVELDVELAVLPGITRSFTVPDQIDPGYSRFVIWIEDPSGERRRYRSPRRYCSARAMRTIRHDRPFRRDVSLFGEAGGYTFGAPGIYRVWAEFSPSARQTLRSNTVELLIEPPAHTRLYEAASSALRQPDVARLLYHRLLRRPLSTLASLEQFLETMGHWEGAGRVGYALGRALLTEAAGTTGSSLERANALRAKGRGLLDRAQDRDGLGVNQRTHIAALLADRSLHPRS